MPPSTAPSPPAVPDSPPDPTPDQVPLDSQAISNKADEVIARLTAQAAPTPSASELEIRRRADDVIARLEAESRAKGTAPGQPGFYPRPPAPLPGFRPPPPGTHLPAYPPFHPPSPSHLFYSQPPQLGPRPPFPPFPHSSPSYAYPPPPFPGYPPLPPQPYAPRPPGWRPPPLPAFNLGAPMRIGFPAPPQSSALPSVGQGMQSPHLPIPPPPTAQSLSNRSPSQATDPAQVSPEIPSPILYTPSTLAADPKLQEVLKALSVDPTASSATETPTLATDAAAFINKATSEPQTKPSAEKSEVASVNGSSIPATPTEVSLDLRPSSDHPDPERQVFLGSLSSTTTLETLRKAFSPLSPIVRIELRTPFAMIEFEEDGAAAMAVDIYDNGKLGGAIIRVERAATSPAEARKRPLDDHDLNHSEDSAIKRAR